MHVDPDCMNLPVATQRSPHAYMAPIAAYPFTGGEMTDVGPSFILHACSVLKCMYTTKNKMTARNNICFPWD